MEGESVNDEHDLGGDERPRRSGEPSPVVADTAPHAGARDRVLAKGLGWCAYTHKHDNSKAALAAAREALEIALERIRNAPAVLADDEISDLINELTS